MKLSSIHITLKQFFLCVFLVFLCIQLPWFDCEFLARKTERESRVICYLVNIESSPALVDEQLTSEITYTIECHYTNHNASAMFFTYKDVMPCLEYGETERYMDYVRDTFTLYVFRYYYGYESNLVKEMKLGQVDKHGLSTVALGNNEHYYHMKFMIIPYMLMYIYVAIFMFYNYYCHEQERVLLTISSKEKVC